MKAPIKISAVIITYNEEDNLGRCISSLTSVVDEVLVVDSFSTDRTKEIAINQGARFIENPFEGHIQQKNFALSKAKHHWVLSLDADEELSDTLIDSILNVKDSPTVNAYKMNRLTSYCGHWIHYSGWYPDTKIRFWNKEVGSWGGTNPHDSVILDKGIVAQKIEGDLLHYSYSSVSQHVLQLDKFTTIAAREALAKGKKLNPVIHIILYPFWIFIKTYFLKLGFLDGFYGFVICINGSFYKFLKYVKLFQLKNNK